MILLDSDDFTALFGAPTSRVVATGARVPAVLWGRSIQGCTQNLREYSLNVTEVYWIEMLTQGPLPLQQENLSFILLMCHWNHVTGRSMERSFYLHVWKDLIESINTHGPAETLDSKSLLWLQGWIFDMYQQIRARRLDSRSFLTNSRSINQLWNN